MRKEGEKDNEEEGWGGLRDGVLDSLEFFGDLLLLDLEVLSLPLQHLWRARTQSGTEREGERERERGQ